MSEHTRLAICHVLNTLPQDNKASTDGVQRTVGKFDVLFGDNIELVSYLTEY